MEGLFFLALIAFCVWHFWGRRRLQINRAVSALQKLPGYFGTFCLIGTNGVTLALDPIARKIAFVDSAGTPQIYNFKDVVAVEACKNGVSLTRTNRGSQIVAAAIGHMLFGEKGFTVGGNTGSRITSEGVKALSIKVYLSDLMYPMREIIFYDGSAIEIGSRKFKRHAAVLDEWYGRIRGVITNP